MRFREYNRALVLECLDRSISLSRSQLVEQTGLSKTTVLAIVTQLLDSGLVELRQDVQAGASGGRVGRKPVLLSLVREDGFALGLDIGNEHIHVALSKLNGRVVAARSADFAVETPVDEVVAIAKQLAERIVSDAGTTIWNCVAVVASVPEPLDRNGNVARAQVNSRWVGLNPARILSDALGIETIVDNDANLAAVGEAQFGRGRGTSDFMYVKISHGVGMGIVLDGRLVHGSNGLAGEIGHTRVREDGLVCTCGNRGCLYTLVTGQYLSSLLHTATGNPNLGVHELWKMGESGSPGAGRVLYDAGSNVGTSVATLCNALNPSLVLVGGSLATSGNWALEGFTSAVRRSAEPQVVSSLVIERGSLGGRAELLGAISTAIGLGRPSTAPTRG